MSRFLFYFKNLQLQSELNFIFFLNFFTSFPKMFFPVFLTISTGFLEKKPNQSYHLEMYHKITLYQIILPV